MNYLKIVEHKPLYQSGEGYWHGYLDLYDFSKSNYCEESRIEAVTTVAATSFGNNEPKSKNKLYEKLFKERNTCLEFVRTGPNFDVSSSLRNNIDLPYSTPTNIEKHNDFVACFKFRAPLMVIAHLVRHRYQFSYNQLSRRYVKVDCGDFFLSKELYDSNQRQEVEDLFVRSMNLYRDMVDDGVKKEIARMVLPSYALMSDMWIIGNKVAWQNLFRTRLSKDEKVQNYTKELVQAMYDMLSVNQTKILLEE